MPTFPFGGFLFQGGGGRGGGGGGGNHSRSNSRSRTMTTTRTSTTMTDEEGDDGPMAKSVTPYPPPLSSRPLQVFLDAEQEEATRTITRTTTTTTSVPPMSSSLSRRDEPPTQQPQDEIIQAARAAAARAKLQHQQEEEEHQERRHRQQQLLRQLQQQLQDEQEEGHDNQEWGDDDEPHIGDAWDLLETIGQRANEQSSDSDDDSTVVEEPQTTTTTTLPALGGEVVSPPQRQQQQPISSSSFTLSALERRRQLRLQLETATVRRPRAVGMESSVSPRTKQDASVKESGEPSGSSTNDTSTRTESMPQTVLQDSSSWRLPSSPPLASPVARSPSQPRTTIQDLSPQESGSQESESAVQVWQQTTQRQVQQQNAEEGGEKQQQTNVLSREDDAEDVLVADNVMMERKLPLQGIPHNEWVASTSIGSGISPVSSPLKAGEEPFEHEPAQALPLRGKHTASSSSSNMPSLGTRYRVPAKAGDASSRLSGGGSAGSRTLVLARNSTTRGTTQSMNSVLASDASASSVPSFHDGTLVDSGTEPIDGKTLVQRLRARRTTESASDVQSLPSRYRVPTKTSGDDAPILQRLRDRATARSGSRSSSSQPGLRPPRVMSSAASPRPPTAGAVSSSSRREVDKSVIEKGRGEKTDAANLVRQLRRRIRIGSSSSERQTLQTQDTVSTRQLEDDPRQSSILDSASVGNASRSSDGIAMLERRHLQNSSHIVSSSVRTTRSTSYSTLSRSRPGSGDGMNPLDPPRRRGKRGKTPPSRRRLKSVDGSQVARASMSDTAFASTAHRRRSQEETFRSRGHSSASVGQPRRIDSTAEDTHAATAQVGGSVRTWHPSPSHAPMDPSEFHARAMARIRSQRRQTMEGLRNDGSDVRVTEK